MIHIEEPLPYQSKNTQARRTQLEDFFNKVLADQTSDFSRVMKRSEILQQSQQMSAALQKFDQLALVGIGGSSLGAQAIDQWMCLKKSKKILYFDNLDPLQFAALSKEIHPRLKQTGFLFVSKSGGSLETLATVDLLVQALGDSILQQSFVITEPGSNPLRTWAEKKDLPLADFPKNIGGRFSVLSQCGLVPAGFLGLDLQKTLEGATAALEAKVSVVQFCDTVVESWQRGKSITQFWLYSSYMKAFGAWFEQLWSESLGKAETLDGNVAPFASTPMVCIGSSHQHSLLQQLMEGQKDKLVLLFRNQEIEQTGDAIRASQFDDKTAYWKRHNFGSILQAQALGTAESLREQGVPVLNLMMKDLSAHSIGWTLMYCELVIATLGAYMRINPYDQPGVEAGKLNSKRRLSEA